jgi:hypothetical protein
MSTEFFSRSDLPAGSTVEYELSGHTGQMAKYRFYVNGREITQLLAEIDGRLPSPQGSLPLPHSPEGPGRALIERVAQRLHGSTKGLWAAQVTLKR